MGSDHKYGVFYRWLLPAIIFQSVYMGGGFTTGREVMQYAARYGVNGIYSIIMVTIGFLVATSLGFELARVFKAFDYKSWIKQVLWKFWPAFDITYIILAIVIIAVVGSAAASILEDMFHIPYMVGAVTIIVVVGLLHFYGRRAIESFETVGTVILYAMYALLWIVTLKTAWSGVEEAFANHVASGTPTQAAISGIQYFAYNLGVIPAVLFVLDRLEERKDSFISGAVASGLVMIAFILTWLSLLAFYNDQDVLNAPVPWYEIMKRVGATWLRGFYVIAVFWTLIETGTGMIHSIVRRLDAQLEEAKGIHLSRSQEAVIATFIIIISIALAKFGVIALVARGYGTLAWIFFAVFFVPLITIGVVRILKPDWKREFWERA